MEKVYWHLPGFCYFYKLNTQIIKLLRKYPEKFNDGYEIGSVYGTFPGAIWNGGRAVFGVMSKKDIKLVLDNYNNLGVPVRFTWTNSILEEKHINDTYCNLIMELANNGKNQVLVNRPVLEEYLRKTYKSVNSNIAGCNTNDTTTANTDGSAQINTNVLTGGYASYMQQFGEAASGFAFISSTTKRLTDIEAVKKELEGDYALVVLDYDLNCDELTLKALEPYADRLEILVDEICYPHCPKRKDHYADESLMQLTFDKDTRYECTNKMTKPSFAEAMKRPHFIGNDKLPQYIERGYRNFKIVGRGLPQDMVLESYLYYLVKPEFREFIKSQLV
ncbi:MAG: hypothetical protein J5718_06975 [Lachnospiraceae bacterium]|nr:hypothetical protein [Lachnospiraceae bacterium]